MAKRPRIEFTWDITYTCNYRCAYCWWDPNWTGLATNFSTYPPAGVWVEAWERIRQWHGEAFVSILGGEPFLYPSFAALVKALAMDQGHRICITSNFSIPVSAFERFVSPLSPERVDLSCSFHPQFATFESVVEKLSFLKSRGFSAPVFVVTYPPMIGALEGYRVELAKKGIPMHLRVFRGIYNGRPYPQSFSVEERRLLHGLLKDEVQIDYQVDLRRTLGELCYSGMVYANVKPNGDVYRCGQSAISEKPMGNMLRGDFRLFDRAVACPFEHCSCQEYEYVARVYEPRLEARAGAGAA